MGTYKETTGDLLDMFEMGKFNAIIHGANCMSAMGAGIARQIRKRFPEAEYADKYYPLPANQRLGCFSHAVMPLGRLIINLYSQYHPGPDADLCAIAIGLKKVAIEYKGKISSIGLPLIGCGIGGLDFKDVKKVIQEELKDFDVTVVFYAPNS